MASPEPDVMAMTWRRPFAVENTGRVVGLLWAVTCEALDGRTAVVDYRLSRDRAQALADALNAVITGTP